MLYKLIVRWHAAAYFLHLSFDADGKRVVAVSLAEAAQRGGRMAGACCAINSTIQSMNTRSLRLTCRLGGKATYSGIGSSCQSSNSGTNSPRASGTRAMYRGSHST